MMNLILHLHIPMVSWTRPKIRQRSFPLLGKSRPFRFLYNAVLIRVHQFQNLPQYLILFRLRYVLRSLIFQPIKLQDFPSIPDSVVVEIVEREE